MADRTKKCNRCQEEPARYEIESTEPAIISNDQLVQVYSCHSCLDWYTDFLTTLGYRQIQVRANPH